MIHGFFPPWSKGESVIKRGEVSHQMSRIFESAIADFSRRDHASGPEEPVVGTFRSVIDVVSAGSHLLIDDLAGKFFDLATPSGSGPLQKKRC
jgi:hypothetical protein